MTKNQIIERLREIAKRANNNDFRVYAVGQDYNLGHSDGMADIGWDIEELIADIVSDTDSEPSTSASIS